MSSPSPPFIESLPTPPSRVSLPAWPTSVSLPARPASQLLPLLPVMRLFSSLPVPLMLAVPVSVRFSTLADKPKLIAACTVSVPCPASSMTWSPLVSTT